MTDLKLQKLSWAFHTLEGEQGRDWLGVQAVVHELVPSEISFDGWVIEKSPSISFIDEN